MNIYKNRPLFIDKGVPVFSEPDEYIENYKRIAKDHIQSIEEKDYRFIDDKMWQEFECSTAAIIRQYCDTESRILDVGVGMGRLLSRIDAKEKHGMDISMDYLLQAKEKAIDACFAKIEDMPYRNDAFDIVVCTDVLEHVINLHSAVKNVMSVLKPGGLLIARTPYKENLKRYVQSDYPYKYAHLRSFDEHSVKLLFERVFGDLLVEVSFVGYRSKEQWLRCKLPIPRWNGIANKCLKVTKLFSKIIYKRFLMTLYMPIEMNFVVRKAS